MKCGGGLGRFGGGKEGVRKLHGLLGGGLLWWQVVVKVLATSYK
jgi:hypothetical protein